MIVAIIYYAVSIYVKRATIHSALRWNTITSQIMQFVPQREKPRLQAVLSKAVFQISHGVDRPYGLTVTSMASPIFMSGNSHRSPLRCSSRSSLRRNEALRVEFGHSRHPPETRDRVHVSTAVLVLLSPAAQGERYTRTHHPLPAAA